MTNRAISMTSSQRGMCLGGGCGARSTAVSGSTAVPGSLGVLKKRFPWFAIPYLQSSRSSRTGRSLTFKLTRRERRHQTMADNYRPRHCDGCDPDPVCRCPSLRYRLRVAPWPAIGLQNPLAQTERFWRDFHQLILCDELDGL